MFEISVFKRFREFRKLYLDLHMVSAGLKADNAFPPFAKPEFFSKYLPSLWCNRYRCQ